MRHWAFAGCASWSAEAGVGGGAAGRWGVHAGARAPQRGCHALDTHSQCRMRTRETRRGRDKRGARSARAEQRLGAGPGVGQGGREGSQTGCDPSHANKIPTRLYLLMQESKNRLQTSPKLTAITINYFPKPKNYSQSSPKKAIIIIII